MTTSAICASLFFVTVASAQNPRPSDWLSDGGDAQRTGIERTDSQFTKATVKDFKVVLERKLGDRQNLLPPIVIGRLISFKGFKELAIIASTSGHLWAVDADLDLIFWERQLPASTKPGCGLTPMPAMMPSTGNAQRAIYIVAADGALRTLNPSTGEDLSPPLPFLPPNANPSNLSVTDNIIHTTTNGDCGAPKASWTIEARTGKVTQSAYTAQTPVTSVTANGVVFSLVENRLRAIDAESGKELFNSGAQITAPLSHTGLSLANGRVYFTTTDSKLWAFGPYMER